MLEHVSLRCSDVAASRKFYEKALAPLGYRVTQDYPEAVGFMEGGHTSFWVSKGDVGTPTHIAFLAKDRKAVDAFHRAALEAGGKDHGAPGLRDYSPTYYAAFVLDPDGHNMEAVTFVRGSAPRKKTAAKKTAAKKAGARKARASKARPKAKRAAKRA
ncbi:VOC family protein [Aggregicoccus sp. 17bor-14]|uniref:VOC family protein n=1 Tax=Myxococcaceae TaxID=31 RepID=UPI00129D08F1|nr:MULTISPECIES: VOC family protein [Myxococcaceae]MBF5043395.1 VOC family protein [Simulacricoccus sp. 17bor-14]MRI89153.1 VOC family protein [Aggregicoccus sp. 17bor-14]